MPIAMKTLKTIFSGLTIVTAVTTGFLLSTKADALTLGGVIDNGPDDLDPRLGHILIEGLDVNVLFGPVVLPPESITVDVESRAKQSNNGVTLSIFGTIVNDSSETASFSLTSSVDFDVDIMVPKDGFIFANLNASLLELNSFGLPTSNGADATVTTTVVGFTPEQVSTSDSVPPNVVIVGENAGLFGRETLVGELVANAGTVTVLTEGSLGPGQALVFNNSFEGGFAIPEPSSTLSLLALGTFGAASTLKRKLKQSKDKKLEKIS